MSGAPEKRRTVREMVAAGISERRACVLLGLSRSVVRYEPHPRDDSALIGAIEELRQRKKRWGARRVWAHLRKQGLVLNLKRVRRIWREQGFTLPRAIKKRRRGVAPPMPVVAGYPGHVWTYDFIFDATCQGRSMKILTVTDEFTRRSLQIRPGRSLTSSHVRRVLSALFATWGPPAFIRSDNGSELTARHLTEWLAEAGVATVHINPGSPWENPYAESFHARLRDECLNMEVFDSVEHAAVLLEGWRIEYNAEHPHSSLAFLSPDEFAAEWAEQNAAVAGVA